MKKKAVILLSGGIDSSVCLALAKSQDFQCYALSIDYHQRNRHELACAAQVAQQIGVAEHRVIQCEAGSWGGSALTDACLTIDGGQHDRPNTYVPARNLIFLSLALGWAEVLSARDIFFGANAADHDHFPDCREAFFAAFSHAASVATRSGIDGDFFRLHTPLLSLHKMQIIRKAKELGVDLDLTFSCYDPINQTEPCHRCSACHLRKSAQVELYLP